MALHDIAYGDRILLLGSRHLSPAQHHDEPIGPLTPAMFHVLLALAGDDLHGYAILKEVELRTSGKVKLSTGTLYGIIKRLLADGLIVERRSRRSSSSASGGRERMMTSAG